MTTRDEDIAAVQKAATADWVAWLSAHPDDRGWLQLPRAEAAINHALDREQERTLEAVVELLGQYSYQPYTHPVATIEPMLSEVRERIADAEST